jgi:hypothetical protein
LAGASARSGDQGGAYRGGQGHPGHVVAHATALERRCLTGTGQQMRQSGSGPERGDVIGRAVGVGTVEAVAGDQAVHQASIAGRHGLEVQADAPQRSGADVGDEHVCVGEQLERGGLAFRGCEVQDDAAL